MAGRAAAEDGSRAGEWAQEVLALARRWFIMLRRERLNLVFSLAQPAIWLLFFGAGMGRAIDVRVVGTADYLSFVLPGIIAFTVIGNGVSSAMPLLFDKEDGYLEKLMAMPISRSSIIVSRFLYQTVLLAGQVILVLAVAFAMGVRLAAGPAGFLVLMLAVALLTLAVTAAFLALAYAVPGHGTFFAVTGFATPPVAPLAWRGPPLTTSTGTGCPEPSATPSSCCPPRVSIPRASRRGRGSMAASSGWMGGCSTCPRAASGRR